ncbi:MBL fold metallo-hydrolase [Humitalea sp. 24SJ18S-53]|uniref:MBL fold metallo-hydrolase n=1 Tax=Humitalea sp. 24SJ18S-53 TaxID=3422307 RepID=UPI003D66E62F
MIKTTWDVVVLVQGYPGKSRGNGGLGWSSVALARAPGRVAILDTGSFSLRRTLVARLAVLGVTPADVTDVLLTHSHYDHSLNWPIFPKATIHIGTQELDWALSRPIDDPLVPDLRSLATSPRLARIAPGASPLPGISTVLTPGHTPFHLTFILAGADHDTIFAGDAAKNLAELTEEAADLTMDAAASARSLRAINALWREKPGTLLICGHDLTMRLDADGTPQRLGTREAGISANLGTSLTGTSVFALE